MPEPQQSQLKHDKKSLYSCLFVNKTWCETVVPILWENPGQYHSYSSSMNKLFKTIILHLSEESRDNLGIDINSITETYQRPLFNYIDYWKFLDISFIEDLIFGRRIIKNSSASVTKNEILKLFINKNRNTKFNHLFIQDKYKKYYDYQLHHISGAEHCFSNLESFYCQGDVDQNVMKTHRAPSKSLVNLIESTKGHLTVIDITYNGIDNERLIQAIYQNCPNLRYLKISLMNNTNSLISEFENLLINCKLLIELIIEIYDRYINLFSWDKLFIILAKSAPIGLFKFKFHSKRFELEDFKLFFDNWKNRNPILLTIGYNPFSINLKEYHQLIDLFEKYKVKEIIKKYFISCL
ncbi:hypothetical protein GLOIN_2v1873941 [Rhizophagus irregularis DAOM 181602=DAOM 197198]|uniref:F-box domain-containing protein n=1 Tax=Rhizophagus irregularis (strain DAOM 181602 / DAOM 197198 / MUCL 43194) TaxID=747089 RepID=A0A2P4Q8R5_RHIID|nr:hypothetical protein GLOIN_2v1873941 [Rhizophagus irregularis DAOM 181602=DAOM 197198]POG74029.1 hypothetical protein GLOIN_2v1873941 [Rhizophagus irregularis DAOM 181602=DAOM 197198]|eukprot:XP_025180895.1 hypothetical protein GLOIN_2v1873941 [Rhizophagus irregularis DAOM 181602=DAOM 197198]